MSEIRSRLARGSLWISVARVITNALSALSTLVLARLLAPADFGLVALATSMLTILAAFTDLSLSQALVHTKDPSRSHYNTAWSLGVARGIVLALIFAAIAPISASLYKEPRIEFVMYALSASALLTGIQNPKIIMLQKELKFHGSVILNISSSLANVVTAIVFAMILKNFWAIILGTIVGQIVGVIVSYTLFPFRPRIGFHHFRKLWQFSVWVSLGQIVNTLNYRSDQLLVGSFLGRAELGLYTVGSRLAVMPGQEIVRPLTMTLFPAFSLVSEDPQRLQRAYQRVQTLVTAIALPASLGFALIADPAVRLVLGEKWVGAIPVVQLVAALYSLDTLGSLVAPLGMSKGQTKVLFVRNCQKLALRLPMMITGIYVGGLMGLLYARIIAGVLGVVVDMTMISRLTGISVFEQLRANARCFVAVSVMMVGTSLIASTLAPHFTDKLGTVMLLGVIISCAVISYVGASLLMWQLAGRPLGPEAEVIRAAHGFARRGRQFLRGRIG